MTQKIAVIGSGISGLAAARRLRGHAHVVLFEAGTYFGGHAHTVDVTLPGANGMDVTHGVDTGFLVLNERTYPGLMALFGDLQVPLALSDMSFSVQVPGAGSFGAGALEWSGSSLTTVFAQRRNLLRPRFLGMLSELLRFNRLCTELAQSGRDAAMVQPLGDFLDQHGFGAAFRHWYLLPMLGCIWSCPTDQMLRFPVATMLRFCHNHGLVQVQNRPRWYTVAGGSRRYVKAMLDGVDARVATPVRRVQRHAAGILIRTPDAVERFDAVVMAVHSDQALHLLSQPTDVERVVLGAIRYQSNRAVLHTDQSVMPGRRSAWAAWNYERAASTAQESARVCLHYWINRLQPLPFGQPVFVSLNPVHAIDPAKVLGEFDYDHPVFDLNAMRAQGRVQDLQGHLGTWYAGAWTGYGFHEDGLQSGYRAADAVLEHLRRQEAA
ncbi:MAG: FAD-dependent oxidoreductase [Burkholderiaceae bacterium]